MADSEEPILPGRKSPIFPITDRRAPVLSRIRGARNNRNNIGGVLGARVGELVLEDDEEKVQEEADRMTASFRAGLANKLGVPEETIDGMITEEFRSILVSHSEVGIVNENETDDDEEDGEDSLEPSDSPIFSSE